LADVIDTIATTYAGENIKQEIPGMVNSLETSLGNLESITERINRLVAVSFKDLDKTMSNLESVTSNIAANNTKINEIFSNLEGISKSIDDSNPGEAITSASEALDETKKTVEGLRETLKTADESFAKLNNILDKVDKGEGSLAKLLNDEQLYQNLETTLSHMSLLAQDLRLNPKRYFSSLVIGKKQKKYVKPDYDPGLDGNK